MLPHGLENLYTIDETARKKTFESSQLCGSYNEKGSDDKKSRKWTVGEMDFEALMRMLDNAVRNSFKFEHFLCDAVSEKPIKLTKSELLTAFQIKIEVFWRSLQMNFCRAFAPVTRIKFPW